MKRDARKLDSALEGFIYQVQMSSMILQGIHDNLDNVAVELLKAPLDKIKVVILFIYFHFVTFSLTRNQSTTAEIHREPGDEQLQLPSCFVRRVVFTCG